jgi:hypothetical protein
MAYNATKRQKQNIYQLNQCLTDDIHNPLSNPNLAVNLNNIKHPERHISDSTCFDPHNPYLDSIIYRQINRYYITYK